MGKTKRVKYPLFNVTEFMIDNHQTNSKRDYKVTLTSEMHSCVTGDIIVRRSINGPRWFVVEAVEDKIFIIPMGSHIPQDMIGTWAVRQHVYLEGE